MRNDQSIVRTHAFIKRVLQISNYFPANMACANLYVISQVLHSKKGVNIMLELTSSVKRVIEIDLNETHEPSDNNIIEEKKKEDTLVLSNVITDTSGEQTNDVKEEKVEIKSEFKAKCYDPFARNPLRAGANLSFYSELETLSNHFHPSVALFAKTIIEGKISDF